MRHTSIPVPGSIQILNLSPSEFSPLISKCEIKVCYLGENRNGSAISREVAEKMAPSLRGSIIAGYYCEEKQDFVSHCEGMTISDKGEICYTRNTRPYGFVDLNAHCWFQDFVDDGVVHTYLMTEGWLWTGEYPECCRVIEKGNGQSMELDDETLVGEWSKDTKTGLEFFIINEAIISELCILGEDVEPCFEGASIQGAQHVQYSFSLDKDFEKNIKIMMFELNKYLSEGGRPLDDIQKDIEEKTEEEVVEAAPAEEVAPAEVIEPTEEVVEPETETEPAAEPEVEAPTEFKADEKKAEDDEDKEKEPKEDEKAPADEGNEDKPADDEDAEKKKKKTEEFELRYNELESNYNSLLAEVQELRQFKLVTERASKEEMINSFYMLSDEDKADVRENIDKYSLDDIEAKLSVICFRNKVSFNTEEDTSASKDTTFSLNSLDTSDSGVPAWIKVVRDVQKNKK